MSSELEARISDLEGIVEERLAALELMVDEWVVAWFRYNRALKERRLNPHGPETDLLVERSRFMNAANALIDDTNRRKYEEKWG